MCPCTQATLNSDLILFFSSDLCFIATESRKTFTICCSLLGKYITLFSLSLQTDREAVQTPKAKGQAVFQHNAIFIHVILSGKENLVCCVCESLMKIELNSH